jgi:hypothetical protein
MSMACNGEVNDGQGHMYSNTFLWKESLNNDGQQFNQAINHLWPSLTEHKRARVAQWVGLHTHDTLYTMFFHSKKPPSKLEEYHKKEILNLHTC